MSNWKERINCKFIAAVIVGALLLMIDAFYNGSPIVNSDTSTYLASGFELETPFDRPITYGLFIRAFSFNGATLWSVIFFQSLIISYLIFSIFKKIFGESFNLFFGTVAILFLSLLTGLSWVISQVMPDIFTSSALLSLVLILTGNNSGGTNITLCFLFFISIAMHMSHLLLFSVLLFTLFIFGKFILPKTEFPKRNPKIFGMFLLTMLAVISMGSALSKSKHVFFMGAMVEHGIVKKYLEDNCAKENFKLCVYKDSLPVRAYDFIWDKKSPFYKIGGWEGTKEEFNEIIYGTLSKPEYIFMHIKESLKATWQQFFDFKIGDGNGIFLKGTLLYERIAAYCKNDISAYSVSKQNQGKLDTLIGFNPIYSFVIFLSLLIICVALFFKNIFSRIIKFIFIVILLGVFFNAWDCGTFANAIDRLGCKMIWLIPFLSIIMMLRIYERRAGIFRKK